MDGLENGQEEQVIETPEQNEEVPEQKETNSYNEEDLEALKKLWIDPENATTEDLIKIAKRAVKAESKIVQEKKAPKKADTWIDNEMRFFFLENPELKDEKDEIIEFMKQDEYKNLAPEKVVILYKALKPKESDTRRLDTPSGTYKPKPKWLAELSEEDALKLPHTEYLKRLKLKGELR